MVDAAAHESRAERAKRGRAARSAVPLAALGELDATADTDAVAFFEQQTPG